MLLNTAEMARVRRIIREQIGTADPRGFCVRDGFLTFDISAYRLIRLGVLTFAVSLAAEYLDGRGVALGSELRVVDWVDPDCDTPDTIPAEARPERVVVRVPIRRAE